MAYDGNGTFVRLYNWTQDAANNIDITASRVDGEDNGIAAGLSLCVTRDGQGKMAADFTPATTATYNLGTAGHTWAGLNVNTGTVGPPTAAGVGFTVNGFSGGGSTAMVVQGGTTSGDRGITVNGGTNSSDFCAIFRPAAGSPNLMLVYGDGGVVVGTPAGGDQGAGTINATGFYQAGAPVYAGIPQNSQSANYTLVLADANKHILHGSLSAHTFTIPANASVAFPIGTAITISNGAPSGGTITLAITSDTLIWSPSGASGTRTLAGCALVTLLKLTATTWVLTGTGIS